MVLDSLLDLFTYKWMLVNTVSLLIIYQYVLRYWNYFSKQNVKFVRGIPIIGSNYKALLGRHTIGEDFKKIYDSHPKERFVGLYGIGGTPSYLIRDPALIKQMAIKDFDHFLNHILTIHEDSDPLIGRILFSMRDQRWKDMRSTLSPAFTGSKMRLMFGLIADVSEISANHIKSQLNGNAKKYEMKLLLEKVTCDVIASCAFGNNINSVEDSNTEFYVTGNGLMEQLGRKAFLYTFFPTLMNFLKLPFFDDKTINFFRKITKENMEYREKNNTVRNDLIDMLIETKRGTLKYTIDDKLDDIGFATVEESSIGKSSVKTKWTDDDLAAQSMLFFLAGFVGISTQISFIFHELAVNSDIQKKLYNEIIETKEKLNGKQINYEAVQNMKYLDMVISETLRKWPIAPMIDRIANKPYTIEDYNGNKVQINVGDGIWFPTLGLHMDPKYFPEPEKFIPERFSEENRLKIPSSVYQPFGSGPRNCIGSRFALMIAKSVVYQMVSSFHIDQCDQTQNPLKLQRLTGNVTAEKGFWVNIGSR